MNYILFLFLVALGWFLLSKTRFVAKSPLNTLEWTILYCIKIIAGLVLGFTVFRLYPGSDYEMIHREGIINYEMLKNDPLLFFRDLFYSPYGNYGSYLSSTGSYWNDLKNNLIIKYVAIINLISRGNYYINSLFFTIPGFIAHLALFKICYKFFPKEKWAIIIGCFLLPSTLYFSSGIHKDAVVFCAYAFALYCVFYPRKLQPAHYAVLVLSLLALLLVRNYILALILPAILAYRLSQRANYRIGYGGIYGLFAIAAIVLSFTSKSPAKIITQKQADFLALPVAATQIESPVLDGTNLSLLTSSPHAFKNVMWAPFEHVFQKPTLILPALEWLIYLLLMIWAASKGRNQLYRTPLLFETMVWFIPLLLFIGWIVPNEGSIIRYRAIYLPLFITPLIITFLRRNNSYYN